MAPRIPILGGRKTGGGNRLSYYWKTKLIISLLIIYFYEQLFPVRLSGAFPTAFESFMSLLVVKILLLDMKCVLELLATGEQTQRWPLFDSIRGWAGQPLHWGDISKKNCSSNLKVKY